MYIKFTTIVIAIFFINFLCINTVQCQSEDSNLMVVIIVMATILLAILILSIVTLLIVWLILRYSKKGVGESATGTEVCGTQNQNHKNSNISPFTPISIMKRNENNPIQHPHKTWSQSIGNINPVFTAGGTLEGPDFTVDDTVVYENTKEHIPSLFERPDQDNSGALSFDLD